MGLKEILAAKKAAAEQAEKGTSNEAKTPEASISTASTSTATVGIQNAGGQDIANATKQQVPVSTPSNAQSTEALVDANGKPLSGFALIQARKKQAAEKALAPVKEQAKVEKEEGKPVEPFNAQFLEEVQKPVEEYKEVQPDGTVTTVDPVDYNHEAYLAATPESKQAYSDLKQRIDSLISLQDTDLKNAMTELKKALMQNTNAVALMLPSDIGQMVIALRKMTGVELAKAEEKKTGKKGTGKAKEPSLTAEQLEAAFQEL